MMNQCGREHFLWQFKEFRTVGTGDDRRVLDQVRHFGQQPRFMTHHAADAPLQALRFRVELAGNLVVALAPLDNDEVLEQPGLVFVERPDLDGAAGAAAGRQEAVPVGDRPRRDVLH